MPIEPRADNEPRADDGSGRPAARPEEHDQPRSRIRVLPVLATAVMVAAASLLGWLAWEHATWARRGRADGTVRAYIVDRARGCRAHRRASGRRQSVRPQRRSADRDRHHGLQDRGRPAPRRRSEEAEAEGGKHGEGIRAAPQAERSGGHRGGAADVRDGSPGRPGRPSAGESQSGSGAG